MDPPESPKVPPGAPEAPWRPHDLGVLGSFFGVISSWCKVFEFVRLVLSPRDCCSGRLAGATSAAVAVGSTNRRRGVRTTATRAAVAATARPSGFVAALPPSLPRRIRTLPSTGCAVRRGRRRRRQSAITWSWCPGRTDGCGNLFAPPPCPENTGGGGEGDVRSQIDKASSARHRRRRRRARLLCNTPAKGEGGRRNERAHATATAAAAGLPRPCAITAAAAAASHSQRGKEGGPCNNSATENIPNSRLH